MAAPDDPGAVQLFPWRVEVGATVRTATGPPVRRRKELHSTVVAVAGVRVPGALVLVDADSFPEPARVVVRVPVFRYRGRPRRLDRPGEYRDENDDVEKLQTTQDPVPSLLDRSAGISAPGLVVVLLIASVDARGSGIPILRVGEGLSPRERNRCDLDQLGAQALTFE